jgi:group I intron endonuclease
MIIYRIKNKINNKVYIGQTSRSIEQRFTEHCNNNISQSAIANAINKYGRENFEIEMLAKADSQEALDELEIFYINTNSSLTPDGYNLKTGGLEGSRYSDESREKMSLARIGTTLSEETKQKMSDTHLKRWKTDDGTLAKKRSKDVKNAWNSADYREKIEKAKTEYWQNPNNRENASKKAIELMTEEQKAFISKRVKESNSKPEIKAKLENLYKNQQRPVLRSDGVVFDSVSLAAAASNTRGSSIIKQIKGRYKTAGNFTFSYLSPITKVESQMPNTLPTIYLLIGAPAAGKSWVARQLLDKFEYVSYDGNRKKDHLDLLRASSNKVKIYDPTFKISTIIRRHSDEFNFIVVGIYESEEVLRARMAGREGKWTDTILKRNEVVKMRFLKYGNGGFIGTSDEVLDYLKGVTCSY